MLRVRVELVPHGVESMAHEVARVEIANTGGNHEVASYTYRISEAASPYSEGLTTAGAIARHRRYAPALHLLQRVLTKALRRASNGAPNAQRSM